MQWNVYLSGEIHSDWRDLIDEAVNAATLPIYLTAPITNHQDSDNCGVHLLGDEGNPFWKDHKAAKINGIRVKKLIQQADVVVVRFGDKYRQWNAAFDAGYAAALGKSIIVIHDPELSHALKEVDAMAAAVVQEPEQVVEVLRYLITGELD